MAEVVAVNISEQKGVVKHTVNEVEFVEDFGIKGDAHASIGGIRQVSLLGQESIQKMIDMGVKGLCFGKFAENITTKGIVLYTLPVGTRLAIGDTVTEITQIGKKCHASDGCEVARAVGMCVMPKEGIFVKVIKGGTVRAGDKITVL